MLGISVRLYEQIQDTQSLNENIHLNRQWTAAMDFECRLQYFSIGTKYIQFVFWVSTFKECLVGIWIVLYI